jgi:hypothetical protein
MAQCKGLMELEDQFMSNNYDCPICGGESETEIGDESIGDVVEEACICSVCNQKWVRIYTHSYDYILNDDGGINVYPRKKHPFCGYLLALFDGLSNCRWNVTTETFEEIKKITESLCGDDKKREMTYTDIDKAIIKLNKLGLDTLPY